MNCSNNSCLWLILILLFCCGDNGLGGVFGGNGCCDNSNDNSCWIIILILLFCCCGNNGFNGCGCDSKC